MIHIAVLMKQYVQLVLDGVKTVECRLTMQARAPFDAITPGERIYFKQSAGPYRATAVADEVLFDSDLTPQRVRALHRDYNDLILGEHSFWQMKRNSTYATLIWLRDVQAVDTGPAIRPLQGVAWLTLDGEPPWRRRDEALQNNALPSSFIVPITAGNIRNNTLYATAVIDQFPADSIGGRTAAQAGRPITFVLHGGKTVRTDIVGPRKLFRTRVWGAWLREHRAQPGDYVVFQPMARRRWHVGLARG